MYEYVQTSSYLFIQHKAPAEFDSSCMWTTDVEFDSKKKKKNKSTGVELDSKQTKTKNNNNNNKSTGKHTYFCHYI